jgi:hypothetical protein
MINEHNHSSPQQKKTGNGQAEREIGKHITTLNRKLQTTGEDAKEPVDKHPSFY